MTKHPLCKAFLCLSLAYSFQASAAHHAHKAQHEHRQHDAHQHGVVTFHYAQDEDALLIELSAPSADLMGFEHQPKTKEQKAAFAKAMRLLNSPDELFTLNVNANCRLQDKEVEFSLAKNAHKDHKHDHHKHEHEHEHESNHSDFSAQYHFSCSEPENLESVKYHWFVKFPNTQKITVVTLTDKGSKSAELSAKSAIFRF